MAKLIKHLKPFAWQILLIFLLLFAQAMTDLALPGYMSRIVNVGIQQGGIQNAVPEVIRAGEMDKLTLFMSDSDKAVVTSDYILLTKTSYPRVTMTNMSKIIPPWPAKLFTS